MEYCKEWKVQKSVVNEINRERWQERKAEGEKKEEWKEGKKSYQRIRNEDRREETKRMKTKGRRERRI